MPNAGQLTKTHPFCADGTWGPGLIKAWHEQGSLDHDIPETAKGVGEPSGLTHYHFWVSFSRS